MKNLLKSITLLLTFGLFAATNCGHKEHIVPVAPAPAPATQPKTTVIYVVRHAEKGTNSPTDPDLSVAGQARAQVLKDSLAGKNIKAVYSTDYKRTKQTATPTATAHGLTIISYNPGSLTALADSVKKHHLHQTVLIVGHSDTVLNTIEAFGATRPVASISDSEYNYLFKIILEENKTPVVEVKRYGN